MAYLLPEVSLFMEKNEHAVCTGESVKVRQVRTLKAKTDETNEALVLLHGFVHRGEHCIINVLANPHLLRSCRSDSFGILVFSKARKGVSNACCKVSHFLFT
jgi:hypothetical protein